MKPIRLMLAALAVALAALSGCASYDTTAPSAQMNPTRDQLKEHWNMAMAGVAARSEEQTRAGLRQLTSDARTTPLTDADREHFMLRLQKVSYAIDKNDWKLAGDELQLLRWRYGHM